MRISKKPEERKSEILDAAEKLFASKGYSRATINDILHEVGIAKGTFYYHFQSKEEVMDAIVMRYIESGVEAAKAIAADPALTAQEKIFRIVTSGGSEEGGKERMIEQLHQIDNAQMHQKSLVETITRLAPVLTEIIEQGIEEGVFRTEYPRETVEFLLVSSQFLFDEGIFQWEPEELAKKAIAFAAVMEKALGAERGSFAYMLGVVAKETNGPAVAGEGS